MSIISLKNVEAISRGDHARKMKYLTQFIELIPQRCSELKEALKNDDRQYIRQIIHKMSPQIQFFDMRGITPTISRVEREYEIMEYDELNDIVKIIVRTLEVALEEVKQLINN